MFAWLYRTLFARRAVWCFEHLDGAAESKVRITLYDPTPGELAAAREVAQQLVWQGWRVVSAPKE